MINAVDRRVEVLAVSEGMLDPDRPVGTESRKTYPVKIASGFFDRYLSGKAILDIGYKGGLDGVVPIVPQAIGIDLDYPGYDGKKLPFPAESQDAIYASHCLAHIKDYRNALREWFRVVKIGGYLVIIVPHQHLFERKRDLPSRWNIDHYRFYTPASFIREVEEVFVPNSYRIRHLVDNDMGFDYSVTPLQAGVGCFEIELVLQKINKPAWDLDDDVSRNHHAGEFLTHLGRRHNFFLEMDFSSIGACSIYGPYVPLAAGNYEVKYFFEAMGIGDQELASKITFDVAQDVGRRRVASVTLLGAQGNGVMRDGTVSLRFANDTPESLFEFSHVDVRTTLSRDVEVLRCLSRTSVAHIMILYPDCRENLRFAAGEAPEGVRRIGRSRAAAQMSCPGVVSRVA